MTALAVALLGGLTPRPAVAQAHEPRGIDLASPWTRAPHAAPSERPAPGPVQELTVIGPAPGAPATRIYGDGEARSLPWDDPELDLEPRGNVHFVLGARVGYLGGQGEFAEAIDLGGTPALDFCLWPKLSLHLRIGLAIGGHGPLGAPSTPLASAYVRPFVLLGIHAVQRVSVRVGAELGPELTADVEVGGAALAQLGVRPAGFFEIALELAIDVRPGVRYDVTRRFYTFVTPRIGAVLLVTF